MPATDRKSKVQQWPSPWPYDFPVTGTAQTPADKVERLAVKDSKPPAAVTRRAVFASTIIGWGAFATAGGVGTLGVVRFLFPNVNFEPPQEFQTKPKGEFNAEQVDESYKEEHGVWMVNTEGKLLAISTVCTHLGCTPNWLSGEAKFKCPCHGSGYYINGVNFEGPTPRPLERYRVYEDAITGNVVVDKNSKCRVELGTCETPGFFLPTA